VTPAVWAWLNLAGSLIVAFALAYAGVRYIRWYYRSIEEDHMPVEWHLEPPGRWWQVPCSGCGRFYGSCECGPGPIAVTITETPAGRTVIWSGGGGGSTSFGNTSTRSALPCKPFDHDRDCLHDESCYATPPLCCPLDSAGYGQHASFEEYDACLRRRALHQQKPPPPHPLLRGPAVYRPAREPRRWHVPMSLHWIGWATAVFTVLAFTAPAAAWWFWLAAACVLLRAALT
jgi:hypothetical protein